MERTANIIGTFTFVNGPGHSGPDFVRDFFGQYGRPIFLQLVRNVCAALFLQLTQVSSGFMRGLKVRRCIFASQARTLLIMSLLQGQLMLSFRAALYTRLWTRLHLAIIGTVFRAGDVFVTPPTSHALAYGAFGNLESLPIPMIAVSQDVKDFTKGEIPSSVSTSRTKCRQYQWDSSCTAMGMSVIFVSRDGYVRDFCEPRWVCDKFLCRDVCVAGFGAVDARANGTIDQCNRRDQKTMREQKTTANMEQTDACQPPKWKCWTPVFHNFGILKNERGF